MKYASAILLCIALLLGEANAQSISERPAVSQKENLPSLIAEALSQNPDIAAEMHKMDAAVRRVPQSCAAKPEAGAGRSLPQSRSRNQWRVVGIRYVLRKNRCVANESAGYL